METKTEKTKKIIGSEVGRIVYFEDFNKLLIEKVDQMIEDSICEQSCCRCAGTENEETCKCIKRKERRDGTREWFMSAGVMYLEEIREIVMTTAREVIEALKEKSFVCECPPRKIEKNN